MKNKKKLALENSVCWESQLSSFQRGPRGHRESG